MSDIAVDTEDCLNKLRKLVLSGDLYPYDREVRQTRWKDELGRLQVWAADIGAHKTGASSLDHRLRDASHIQVQTIRVLQRLQRTLDDLQGINQSDIPSDPSDSDDEDEQSEIQFLYHGLRDTINNLFQISIAIRRPAHHDRLSGTQRTDSLDFEPLDKKYVVGKYPNADTEIQSRLGLAISQRRAILRYRERHSENFRRELGTPPDDEQSTKLGSRYLTRLYYKTQESGKQSSSSPSSYAQSHLHSHGRRLLPYFPPIVRMGAPYECPYCSATVTYLGEEDRVRHVFQDILPYICVFPNCPTPNRLYESRHEWCFHLKSQHSITGGPTGEIACPLCMSITAVGQKFEKHLGDHLVELALLALPSSDLDSTGRPLSYIHPEKGKSQDPGVESAPEKSHASLYQRSLTALDPMPDHLDEISTQEPEFSGSLQAVQSKATARPGFADGSDIMQSRGEALAMNIDSIGGQAENDLQVGSSKNVAHYTQQAEEAVEADAMMSDAGIADKRTLRVNTHGHKFEFAWEDCQTWESMDKTIKQACIDYEDIGPWVTQGKYYLVDLDGIHLTPRNWEAVSQPNSTITLRILLDLEKLETTEAPRKAPKAGTGASWLYICCQCHDGPKVYNTQPYCVNCSHMACSACIPVK